MRIGTQKINLNIPLRVNIALGTACIAFFLILLRLWYLQILRGDEFRNRSENNRLRTVYIPAPRGLILDRDGQVLVTNRPSFNIDLITEDSPNPKETLHKLAAMLDYDPEYLLGKIRHQKKRRRFEPKQILADIPRDVVAKVVAERYALPGVIVNVTPARSYVYGELASHVLGYIREITQKQLDSASYAKYRPGDLVGQYGIEAELEQSLQGTRGVQAVVVNAMGTRIGESSFQPESAGINVTLTIDLSLQQAADEEMSDKRGGIVAMDPNTGEILAMVSSPKFNPNSFVGEISAETWKDLISGPEHRLNNRVVQGAYPPGSVFKIFMAAAALSEGVVTENDRFYCPGAFYFGNHTFKCWQKKGHGSVNFREGIVQSCDVYFYNLGQRLGVDRIHDYATRFGLGMPTGLHLCEENKGVVPSTKWKRNFFSDPANQKWYPGETISVAIGQGATTVTPLQVTRAVSALVNGGILYRPLLIRKLSNTGGSFRDNEFGSEILGKVDVDPKVLNKVREALVGVVNDPRGTAHRAQLAKEFGITVGGKTGTAQAGTKDYKQIAGAFSDHAWFVGYAPAEKPEIVVTALVEYGGHGGVAAAPLVKKVMEAYFHKKFPNIVIPDPKAAKEKEKVHATLD